VAIAAGAGDDVVNDGTIAMTGPRNVGIQVRTYGVITNNGSVAVSGPGSAAVKIKGMFGSLLNGGAITAGDGAYAIKSGGTAQGALVVNTGVIDGRVKIVAGPDARFENSGWLGISSPGAGTTHEISGVFAQTSAGVLALRIRGIRNDALDVDGAARLAGTVMPTFLPGTLQNSYTILSATDEVTGTFDALAPVGLPSFVAASVDYNATDVELDLKAELAQVFGLTRNQRAGGAAFDGAFNAGGGIPDGLNAALFGLSESQLGTALNAQSGEVYASVQTVLLNDPVRTRRGAPPSPPVVLRGPVRAGQRPRLRRNAGHRAGRCGTRP
jgi:subtilase-type serine protease